MCVYPGERTGKGWRDGELKSNSERWREARFVSACVGRCVFLFTKETECVIRLGSSDFLFVAVLVTNNT